METSSPRGYRELDRLLPQSDLREASPEYVAGRACGLADGALLPGCKYSYESLSADDLHRIFHLVEQGGDLLFLGCVAWNLGHALMDNQDYEQAAECFRRVLSSGRALEDRFLIEAARLADRVCCELSVDRHANGGLREAQRRLARSLFQVEQEDLDSIAETLDDAATASVPPARLTALLDFESERPANGSLPDSSTLLGNGRVTYADVSASARRLLRVRFFGRFELSCDGVAVPVRGSNKALTVLKYLLAHQSQPVSQDYLMGWLWPESNARRARWSLNSAIYTLRKLLDGHLPPVAPPGYILLDHDRYQLSSLLRLSSDIQEFESCFEVGSSLEKRGRTSEAAAEYRKALELYRGDYLVEDLYEDWTMIERERLANSYLEMLGRLIVCHMDSGQPEEGIQLCYRMLEKDECHENAHRLLMRCYDRLDLRVQALRQYRLCEQTLREKYGIAPSQETQTLHRNLLEV